MQRRWFAIGAVALASTRAAGADPSAGRVESTTSRWSAAGHVIVTEAVVRHDDGRSAIVTTLGGSVGGVGMTISHHPQLAVGDLVDVVSGVRLPTPRARGELGSARYGVQRTTRSARPLYHPSACLELVYDERGTSRIDELREWEAFDIAFAAWTASARGCAELSADTRIAAVTSGRDGINTIQFRDERWCRPATAREPELCLDPDAVAVTSVWFIDDPGDLRDGQILEVDIEVNAAGFPLALDPIGPDAIDLVGVATHEIGHALGLAHNCGTGSEVWPTDVDDQSVPSCDVDDPEVVAATMYVDVQPGSTMLRTLEAADREAVCAVARGGECRGGAIGGCSVTDSSDAAISALLVGLAVLVWSLRSSRARVRAPSIAIADEIGSGG